MKYIYFLILAGMLSACGPSDDKILADVNTSLASAGGKVTATVSKGVVTLSGECPDDPCKSGSEASVKSVKGVKEVVNNISVAPPPPPEPAVVINPDQALITSIDGVLSDYKTVKATVTDGVVTLTGQLKRSQLAELMQKVTAAKPKKIENKLQIK